MRLYLVLLSAVLITDVAMSQQLKRDSDAPRLEGVWTLKSGVSNGKPLEAEDVDSTLLVFRNGRITISRDQEGRFELNSNARPKAIDITIKAKSHRGIYSFENGELKICLAEVDRGRPEKFESLSGSERTLLILEHDASSSADVVAPRRPQEPKRPYPYNDIEVSYESEASDIRFAGTLTTPRKGGPFPAVLLVTGSGQQDRDETHKGHKPFLVLADYLTRRGIAVLRVDDREMGGTTGSAAKATSADFADDVLSGVRFLRRRKDIRPSHIGLVGHSEGGLIAPIAAVKSPDVAFIVLMAGPGVPGDQILYRQDALLSQANDASKFAISRYRAFQERMFAVLKDETDSRVAESRIREIVRQEMSGVSDEQKRKLATQSIVVDGRYQDTYRGELSPWFRFFLTHDPRSTLQRVQCPVLAIIGENDLFVPPKENLAAIDEALKAGGNTKSLVKELPGLNHMFQTANSEAPEKYRETIAPIALQTMADWIEQQTSK